MSNGAKETPFIDMGAQQIGCAGNADGKYWAIWPKVVRGTWESYYRSKWAIIGPPSNDFYAANGTLRLPNQNALGSIKPLLLLEKAKTAIIETVADFNAHHARIAKERAEAEKAKERAHDPWARENRLAREAERAKEPQPRRILEAVELGGNTTDSQCRNCPKNTTTHCARDEAYIFNRSGWNRRTNRCLAAEKRYKVLRGLFGEAK